MARAQQGPELLNFVIGCFLADLAIALESNDQADTIRELLKILVKSQTLWGPVFTAIVAENLQWRTHTLRLIRWT